MAYRIDLSKPAAEILLDRINYVFGTSYRPDQIEFNSRGAWPLTLDERRAKGVESKIAAKFKNGVYGSREFYMTRADLTELLHDVVVEVPQGAVTWSHYLAPYIVESLGLQLSELDLWVEPIDSSHGIYLARIAPHHPSFKGSITVEFVDPQPRRLAELVTLRNLDGFRFGEFL